MVKAGELVIMPAINLRVIGLQVVNTAGSGDAFVGTFSAMKVLGRDDVESLFMASLSGSIKASRQETRGSPTLEELAKFSRLVEVKYRKQKL